MSEKLIVPKDYNGYDREKRSEQFTIEKDFKAEVSDLFDSILPAEWQEFVDFRFTDSFFTVKGKSSWRGNKICGFKRGNEFNLKPEQVDKINQFIQSAAESRARLNAHYTEFTRLKNLVEPILERYQDGEFDLDFKDQPFRIEIELKGRERWQTQGKTVIYQDEEISEPRRDSHTNIESISDAEKFITEFRPISRKISEFAEKLKSELPKEFFTQE